jgi:hypothetical protein
METKKLEVESRGEVVNEKQIYFEVTGPPTRGRVLGMGVGIKPRDMYGITSSSQGCRKGCQEDRLKEKEEFEACLKEIEDKRLTEKKEMKDMRLAEKKKKEMEERIIQMEAQMPLMVANMLKSMGITQGSMQVLTTQVHFSIYVIVEYICIINVNVVFVGYDIHVTIGVYLLICM